MKPLFVFAVLLGIVARAQSSTELQQHSSGSALEIPLAVDAPDAYSVGGSVSAPVVLKQSEAAYSKEAIKKKISGSVLLSLVVDENGMPQDIKVVRSLGYGLDEQAIKAAQNYRFRPAMQNGRPVKVFLKLEINFQI